MAQCPLTEFLEPPESRPLPPHPHGSPMPLTPRPEATETPLWWSSQAVSEALPVRSEEGKASLYQHHNNEAATGGTRVGPWEVESKKPKADLSGGTFCPQTCSLSAVYQLENKPRMSEGLGCRDPPSILQGHLVCPVQGPPSMISLGKKRFSFKE